MYYLGWVLLASELLVYLPAFVCLPVPLSVEEEEEEGREFPPAPIKLSRSMSNGLNPVRTVAGKLTLGMP